jgi:hypothetical protein
VVDLGIDLELVRTVVGDDSGFGAAATVALVEPGFGGLYLELDLVFEVDLQTAVAGTELAERLASQMLIAAR